MSQHRSSAHEPEPGRPASRRSPAITVLSAAVLAVVLVGGWALRGTVFGDGSGSTAALGSPSPAPVTVSASPDAPATPRPSATPAARATPIVQRGDGTYSLASGGTALVGHGRLYRYKVAVEDGIGVSPAAFAAQVDAILDNTRQGWSADGLFAFQRVSSGPAAFTVYLVSPQTAITKCWNLIHLHVNEYGGVNCSNNGDTVVMNMNRWINLTGYYTGHPDLYHALAINHEVGHSLGHGHVTCPGPGLPAPVMMQQIKGLNGCVINGWPYSPSGRYLTGPPTR